jgi:hypothetical protein
MAARLPETGHPRLPETGDHRADADDGTPAALGHRRRQGRDKEERHLDVDREGLVELLLSGQLRWP